MTNLIFILLLGIPGSLDLNPRLRWYTLETDHFAVHLPAHGLPDAAELELPLELSAIAEEIHPRLVAFTGWSPAEKTNVIVADFFDYSNGWAAPFPNNTITILPSLPAGDRTNYDNWLRTLFVHEYAHILQLDAARNGMALLRRVFGRLIMPLALAPAWLHEGYAIRAETRFSGFGRNRSPEYSLLLKTAARSATLLPPDRCSNYELRHWPGGLAPYLYGSRFLDWLADNFNPVLPESLNHALARSLPWTESHHLRRLTGQNLNKLWQAWLASMSESSETSRSDTPSLQLLTRDGFWKSSPVWSRSGREIYYFSRTGIDYPGIRLLDRATGHEKRLYRGVVNGSLALSRDGRQLLFGELNVVDNTFEISDLVSVELSSGRKRRLTSRLRARDPDCAPDTSLIVFVSEQAGRNRICLLDTITGQISFLVEPQERIAYHCPRFSPNGRWIAVGTNRPGGLADIELIDVKTGWTTPLTEDAANDINPCWSPTGRYVYFSSDRTGSWQLFAFEITTGRFWQCTDLGTGIFQPAVAPDNRSIVAVTNSPAGEEIAVLPVDASGWRRVASESLDLDQGQTLTTLPVEDNHPAHSARIATNQPTLYYYNPWPTLRPRFWLPDVGLSPELRTGALVLGWDALAIHRYSFAAGYAVTSRSPYVTGSYSYWNWYLKPTLAITATIPTQNGEIVVGLPLRSYWSRHWLDFAISLQHDSAFAGQISTSWSWSTTFTGRFAVAPTRGHTLGIAVEHSGPETFTSHRLTRTFAVASIYSSIIRRDWSLRVRVAGGIALGEPDYVKHALRLTGGRGSLAVRGFSSLDHYGPALATASLQLHTPIYWFERGLGSLPVFVRNLNVAPFIDAGAVSVTDTVWLGTGVELGVDFLLSHLLPARLSFGAAGGLLPQRDYQLYLTFSSELLSTLTARPVSGLRRMLAQAD